MPQHLTKLARIILLVLRHAEEQGLSRSSLMHEAGLTDRELADPDARVSASKQARLWRAIADRVVDPAFGLRMGLRSRARDFGVVGYAMYYSVDLYHALERLARYVSIVSEAIQIDIEPSDRGARVIANAHPAFDALRHPVDSRLATILAISRDITGVAIAPVEVSLPQRDPSHVSEHQELLGCPVRVDAARPWIEFREQDLARPVPAGDETLTGYLDEVADRTLVALTSGEGFSSAVRKTLWSELSGGRPTAAAIASRLGVSLRTLQRRLRDEGTSFEVLLEQLRRDLALKLVRDPTLAVYEVAFLLGYSQPSAFHRAFRRWRGQSPREFRIEARA